MASKAEKRDRFVRVASRRVEKILTDIRALSKCANKSNYEYSAEDVNKMTRAIREEVRLMEALYKQSLDDETATFSF